MEAEAALIVPLADCMPFALSSRRHKLDLNSITSPLFLWPLVSHVLCGTFAGQGMFRCLVRALTAEAVEHELLIA